MTYQEKIEKLIATIDVVYYECESLRDVATDLEKPHWNRTRKGLFEASGTLTDLKSSLTTERQNLPI